MKNLSLTTIGLVAGIFFFAHAMVRDSNAWPIIWPALAGGMAVYLTSRDRPGFIKGVGAAVKTGAIAGIVFLIATAATLAMLASPSFARAARAIAGSTPIVMNEVVLVSLAAAALIGTIGAMLTGMAAYPVSRRLT